MKKCNYAPCKNLTELSFCCRSCEWASKNCITIPVLGEQKSQLKEEEKRTGLGQSQKERVQNKYEKNPFKPTTNIEKKEMNKEQSTQEITGTDKMNINENTTQEIKQPLRKAFYEEEKKETLSMESRILLKSLNKDRLDSIDYLNDSTKQLLIMARATMAKKIDDHGEVIRNPSLSDHKDLVYILSEVRNQLKVKLGYLKLGREIARDL
jgi:hypothetical protein